MKLSEPFKIKSNEPAGYYDCALRAIGQDLADLFPHQLEIEYRGGSFEVQVRCDRKRAEKKSPPVQKSGLRNVFHKLATYELGKAPEGAEIATIARSYNPDDINRLNEIGLHRRTQAGKIPDIRNLGEALRTIGRVIDAEEGRLIKVFRDQRGIAFEYVDKGGATHKAEMTHSELYKLQQRFYDKRDSSDSVDPWKGHA